MSKSCTREEHKWIKQDSLDIELRQNRGAEVAKTTKKILLILQKFMKTLKIKWMKWAPYITYGLSLKTM